MVLPVITQNWTSTPEGNIIQLLACVGQVEDTPAACRPPKSTTAIATGQNLTATGRHRWSEAIQGQSSQVQKHLEAARGSQTTQS